jgi:hypothetical protein
MIIIQGRSCVNDFFVSFYPNVLKDGFSGVGITRPSGSAEKGGGEICRIG